MKSTPYLRNLKILALSLGFTSVIAQIVYMREFATAFYGNEMSYAVILAAWLCGISMGSFALSRLAARIREPGRVLSVLLILKALMIPSGILAIRCVKVVLNIPTGQIMGMLPMIGSAFVLLMPVTVLLGAFFTLLCRWAETKKSEDTARQVGTIYIWESLGAGIGGILVSFVLILFFSGWTIAVLIGAVNLLILLLVLKRSYLAGYRIAFMLLLAVMVLSLAGGFEGMERWSRSVQWQGFQVVDVTESKYGNLALVQRSGAFSLYENGLLSFTTGDAFAAEDNVHFALLAHPHPRRVLLIGNGLNGSLGEVLKYPQTKVDYVELDARLLDFSKQHLPPAMLAALQDPRTKVIHSDARLYVKHSPVRYDVVLVNLSDPYTALLNRYYTLEFYQEVRAILNPQGILAFRVSSSENYINQEARAFLRSLNTTLKQVFGQVRVIPGDSNVFLASRDSKGLNLTADFFGRRLEQRQIQTQYVHAAYLPFRLNELRVNELKDILKTPGQINTDMRPIAFLYDITLWSTHFNSVFRNFMGRLQGLTFYPLLAIPVALFILGMLLTSRYRMLPVNLSIATTGFSEIIYQIIVILAFQVLYGYVYYKVGLIVTSFMIGLVSGGWLARRLSIQPRASLSAYYIRIQAGIMLYPFLLPFIFTVFRKSAFLGQGGGLLATLFAALPLAAGFMGGMQYVLAVNLGSKSLAGSQSTSGYSGLLYALDVLGSTVGALLAGAILIPLLGIDQVAYFCVVLNAVVLILILWKNKIWVVQ